MATVNELRQDLSKRRAAGFMPSIRCTGSVWEANPVRARYPARRPEATVSQDRQCDGSPTQQAQRRWAGSARSHGPRPQVSRSTLGCGCAGSRGGAQSNCGMCMVGQGGHHTVTARFSGSSSLHQDGP